MSTIINIYETIIQFCGDAIIWLWTEATVQQLLIIFVLFILLIRLDRALKILIAEHIKPAIADAKWKFQLRQIMRLNKKFKKKRQAE